MNHPPQRKPKRLYPGDTIGVITPASPGNLESADQGILWLEKQGFHVKLGKSVNQANDYLAGTDAERAADIHDMFAAPDVDGIICMRGGYGTMRLLEQLDYSLIQCHPKVFVGYSDITALHTSIGQRTGLVTFHGPMVSSDIGKDLTEYTGNALLRAITSAEPLGLIDNPPLFPSPEFIVPGIAEGCLTGGNLSLIASTLGTPYEINTQGKILCLEEVGEEPYRMDRMLTQLLLAGKLQEAAGIVMGVCADCDPMPDAKSPGIQLEEVIQDRLGSLKKPVLYQLHFGHTENQVTLPFGVTARLDTNGLVITETATK